MGWDQSGGSRVARVDPRPSPLLSPNRLVVRAYAARGARLWLATRAAVSIVFLFGRVNPLDFSVSGSMRMVAIAVGVSFLETHYRRERVLLANLGVRPQMLTVLFVAPALMGEIALYLGTVAML